MRALWSDRQSCSHNVSQKVKRIRRFLIKGGTCPECVVPGAKMAQMSATCLRNTFRNSLIALLSRLSQSTVPFFFMREEYHNFLLLRLHQMTVLRQVSAWNRFFRDFLYVGAGGRGSKGNFLEVCFGRIPYGSFHTKATSKCHVGVHETSVDDIALRYGSRQKRGSLRLVHFQDTLRD